jgi:hypothetical protein
VRNACDGLTFPQFAHAYFRPPNLVTAWKKQAEQSQVGPQTCQRSLSIRSWCSCSCWPGHIFPREGMCPAFGSGDLAASILLKHAPIGDNEDDYDVLADGKVVGRIFVSHSAAGSAMDVDHRLWPPRRPHANPWLRADVRRGTDRVRQVLATELEEGRVDIRRVVLLVALGAAVIAASFLTILNYWTKRGWRTREAAMAAFAESWRGS